MSDPCACLTGDPASAAGPAAAARRAWAANECIRHRGAAAAALALLLLPLAGCGPSPQPGDDPPSAGDDAHLRDLLAGPSAASASAMPLAWRGLRARAEGGELPVDANGIPHTLDLRRRKTTEAGRYVVALEPPREGAALHAMHRYLVRVTTPEGQPVHDAALSFVGGMPLHGHGFPTAPAFGEEIAPGVYPLDGVRFAMAGWWQLILSVAAGGTTDTVTFDLAVTP